MVATPVAKVAFFHWCWCIAPMLFNWPLPLNLLCRRNMNIISDNGTDRWLRPMAPGHEQVVLGVRARTNFEYSEGDVPVPEMIALPTHDGRIQIAPVPRLPKVRVGYGAIVSRGT